jgi:hypothetical protein
VGLADDDVGIRREIGAHGIELQHGEPPVRRIQLSETVVAIGSASLADSEFNGGLRQLFETVSSRN